MSTDPNSPDEADDEASAPNDGRNGGRDSLFLAAQIRTAGEPPFPVRIRNLSEGGLMAELPHALDPDDRVEVEVRGVGWVKGRVAWQTGGRAGIAFDEVIDPQRARKPVGASAPAPAVMRPVLPPR